MLVLHFRHGLTETHPYISFGGRKIRENAGRNFGRDVLEIFVDSGAKLRRSKFGRFVIIGEAMDEF